MNLISRIVRPAIAIVHVFMKWPASLSFPASIAANNFSHFSMGAESSVSPILAPDDDSATHRHTYRSILYQLTRRLRRLDLDFATPFRLSKPARQKRDWKDIGISAGGGPTGEFLATLW